MNSVNLLNENDVINFSNKIIQLLPKFKQNPDLCKVFNNSYTMKTKTLQIARIGSSLNEILIRSEYTFKSTRNQIVILECGQLTSLKFFPNATSTHLLICNDSGGTIKSTTLEHLNFNKESIQEDLFMYSTVHAYPIIQYLIYSLSNAEITPKKKSTQFDLHLSEDCVYSIQDVFKLYDV